jgi:outer membrane protein assembly factor BamB
VRFSSVPVPPTAAGQNGSNGDEPLVVGDRVYGVLGAGEMRVWSTTGSTGTSPLATRVLPGGEEFMGTPALQGTTSTGTLYAVTSGARLVALDAATLEVEWSVDGVGQASDQVAPLVVGGRVLLAVGGDLVAVDTTSHTVTWRHALGAGVGPHSASTDGTLAFAYAECDVVAIRVADGIEEWRSSLAWNGSGCNSPQAYWPQFRVAPVVRDGVVYASSYAEGTAALDASSGTALWRTRAFVFGPTPVVTENWVVLTGAYQKALLVLDRDTGEVVRESTMDEVPDIDSSPSVVGDLAVFRTNGRIQAVDLLTMSPVWTSPSLGTDFTAGAVSVQGGRLWAYTGDGRVVGLGPAG